MVKFETAKIFTAQQIVGNLTVTGPEQAKLLVMLDDILRKGIEEKEPEAGVKEGETDGSSK